MDLETAITERRSIRAFKTDPIPSEVLKSIIDLALRAPSWGNTQPWEIFIVLGEKIARLKKAFKEKFEKNEVPDPDLAMPTDWSESCLKRYKYLGKSLFEKIGISRDDHISRQQYYSNMYQGFGAPVFIYICLDKKLSNYSILDAGIFIQTLCLTAVSKGLGSCIMTHLVLYPDIVRKELGIPESKIIIMGVALGYEDTEAKINKFRSTREIEEVMVKWFF